MTAFQLLTHSKSTKNNILRPTARFITILAQLDKKTSINEYIGKNCAQCIHSQFVKLEMRLILQYNDKHFSEVSPLRLLPSANW